MGDQADDILLQFRLTKEESTNYDKVLSSFDLYFAPKTNVIFERAKFNSRTQNIGESVTDYVTSLHGLAEKCNYGSLKDELIRDRIVLGIIDKALSEKMQLDENLTLEIAQKMVKQSEDVKEQQKALLPGPSFSQIDELTKKKTFSSPTCSYCLHSPIHKRIKCPARNAVCRLCNLKGHFSRACRKKIENKTWQPNHNKEYSTPDKLEYQFFPACGTSLKFSVQAKSDAHIALTPSPTENDKIIEIFIGGWGNKKSAIRLNKQTPDVVCIETPDILNDGEFKDFLLTWSGNTISLSTPDHPDLLRWENPESFPITHYGICTGWGSVGSWKIVISLGRWVATSKGELPPDAIEGGFDNEPLYIARANFNGATIPGKLVPSHQVCYISWGGKEHGIEEYEVLCGYRTEWVKSSEGAVPPGSIPGGASENGETLYIARVEHLGTKTIGKVHPSHNSSYIPYAGEEVPYAEYEVLVLA